MADICTFLRLARQHRLLSLAQPELAQAHRDTARIWLGYARRAPAPKLP